MFAWLHASMTDFRRCSLSFVTVKMAMLIILISPIREDSDLVP